MAFIFPHFLNYLFTYFRVIEAQREIYRGGKQTKRASICWFTMQMACGVQVWARLKPGAGNSIWVSHAGERASTTRFITAFSEALRQQEVEIRSEARTQASTLSWDGGFLTDRTNVNSYFFKWIFFQFYHYRYFSFIIFPIGYMIIILYFKLNFVFQNQLVQLSFPTLQNSKL